MDEEDREEQFEEDVEDLLEEIDETFDRLDKREGDEDVWEKVLYDEDGNEVAFVFDKLHSLGSEDQDCGPEEKYRTSTVSVSSALMRVLFLKIQSSLLRILLSSSPALLPNPSSGSAPMKSQMSPNSLLMVPHALMLSKENWVTVGFWQLWPT
ncbi:hypothetical protein OTU49_009721 [Cherax quadricarinatus]|uniref:Uncharacterized protein n=1 Tax=Cherax quadricarinatus TaxID=27406 RepID=A0AAW0WIT0_CHEQU